MGIGRLIDKFSSFLHENPWAFPAALLTAGTAASLGGAAVAGAAGAAEGGAGIAGSAAAAELAAPLASGGSLAGWGAGTTAADLGSAMAFGEYGAGSGGSLAGLESSLVSDGTLSSQIANMIAQGVGPSDFTAAMAGDAYMPAALGADGTGTASIGSKLGSLLASGNGLSPRNAMLLAQVLSSGSGSSQDRSIPQGSPLFGNNVSQSPGVMTQEQITKKWLLENDPNTYARIYGSPQPMGA
jgi:hypothetical protein